MDTVQQLTELMIKSLRSSAHDDPLDTLACLGEDSALRSQIAYDILSKAKDTSKLVRVQRSVIRNGKTVLTHLWVLPSKVKKGDIVIKNKQLLDNADPAEPKSAKAKKAGTAHVGEEQSAQKPAKPSAKPDMSALDKLKAKQAKAKPKVAAKASVPAKPAAPNTKAIPKPEPKPVPDKPKKKTKPKAEQDPGKKTAPPNPAGSTEKPASNQAKPKVQPKPKSKPKTDAKKQEQPKADIFGYNICHESILQQTYDHAGLKESDNLASTASFNAAVKALQGIKQAGPAHVTAGAGKALEALILQHNESLYGKDTLKQAAEKYQGTDAAKHYSPELIASAVSAWKDGSYGAIRSQSVKHKADDDPVNNLYSKCLTDMIRHSGTVQKDTLYRGIHVSSGFLRSALENGSFDTEGLVSTSSDAATARKFALQADKGEVSVILEMPASLKMKTLELDNESLLSTHGKFSVKSVTVDADGIYHVQLKTKANGVTKPLADDSVYDKLGAAKPDVPKPGTMDKALYKQIVTQQTGKSPTAYISIYDIQACLPYVYSTYGYQDAAKFITEYAKDEYKVNMWTSRFADTKSGFAPELLAMARDKWVHNGYEPMRRMENESLSDAASGEDIFFKVCVDAFNSMVDNDGIAQPSMLYRGLQFYGKKNSYSQAKVGGTVSLGSISSFTATKDIAVKDFAGPGGIVLKIPKKCKAKCKYVAGLGEDEYIVPDGDYVVKRREVKKSITYLTLEFA